MIKINKSKKPPKILEENSKKWTEDLIKAVIKYGGYSKIPKQEKDSLLKYYKAKEIQDSLSNSSYGKCAFCECIPSESGNLEVEHFAPKSIYYDLAFEWDNLLPICRRCNGAKSDFDTINNSIVNPAKEEPEQYFDFNYINMIASKYSPDKEKSERTIEVCDLNANRLYKSRADLLVSLSDYIKTLKLFINEYDEADTPRKKKNRINKLIDSLDIIENLSDSKHKYAFFSRNFLQKNSVYIRAKEIVDDYNAQQCSNL